MLRICATHRRTARRSAVDKVAAAFCSRCVSTHVRREDWTQSTLPPSPPRRPCPCSRTPTNALLVEVLRVCVRGAGFDHAESAPSWERRRLTAPHREHGLAGRALACCRVLGDGLVQKSFSLQLGLGPDPTPSPSTTLRFAPAVVVSAPIATPLARAAFADAALACTAHGPTHPHFFLPSSPLPTPPTSHYAAPHCIHPSCLPADLTPLEVRRVSSVPYSHISLIL